METLASGTIVACAALHAVMGFVETVLFRRRFVRERLGYSDEQAELLAPVVAHVGVHNLFLALALALCVSPPETLGRELRTFALAWVLASALQAAVALKKLFPQVVQIALAIAALVFVWLAGPAAS